jgi:hypothetical protein
MPVHCQLEAVAASGVVTCCVESDCSPQQDADCTEDFCGSLESETYFPQKSQTLAKVPVLQPIDFTFEAIHFEPAFQARSSTAGYVPILACAWQFVFRTAAPPRAPSYLS